MRVILLMRHAKSDWSSEGLSDFNRPISEKGTKDALHQAQALLRQGYRPDVILSSPAIRAWQTAHLLAQVTSLPHQWVRALMPFYWEDAEAIYEALRELPEKINTVALVGHNPLWSDLASRWRGEVVEMATADIIGFAWNGTWREVPHTELDFLFHLRRTE
ncbi:MAG: histidine phosphatase family protein [Bacteroidia bacterium]|nr:histidine phosphatase family protein [Bacteroidia bacterium]MCX7652678.1 histidine phosphatase family protein [Bacteroidia bacterium]MDW8416968.1 histidine phosphatase family protein [Bacteroidia bacterium]